MAKRQTRRCISVNRSAYEAAKLEAARRGMTLAALTEAGFAAIGVTFAAHPQQTPELVQVSAERRAQSMAKRPSRERQVLGDEAADALGFA